MSGYIKLHRAVRGTAIAQHPEYFAAWVHLLCMASHKPHRQIVGTKVVDLEPGQLVFGRQRFSVNTGISENKVRAALNVMKELNMITSKSHAKFSVITVVNWLKYQSESPANNQQSTSTPPASNHKQEGSKKGERMYQEIDIVISYLNDVAGKRFKNTQGNAKHITARLKEGHTVEDMKKVVDKKTSEWKGTEQEKYLRPETLFNSVKFDGYVNSLEVPNETGRGGFPAHQQGNYNGDGWADGFDPLAGDFDDLA